MIPIISGLIGLGQTYLENRQVKAKAKSDAETKLIEQAGSWEEIHAKGSNHSWKDEFWTIIFSIPLVMAFVPGLVVYVEEGFKALESTPEWYRYSVGVLVAASVGIRQFNKFKIGK